MKTYYKCLAIVALTIGMTSCADDSTLTDELMQESPLKSYSLTTSENGSYVLEQNLSEGTTSTVLTNSNGNEILLTDGYTESDTKTTVLPLLNNELKIDFITENDIAIPGIKILDEKITSANAKNIDFVTDYSFSLLEDGSYQLDFTVASNYVPTFVYNEELARHEIRLDFGVTGGKNSYSKNYLKFEGEKINIVFLRSITTTTLSARSSNKYLPEPPEFTID